MDKETFVRLIDERADSLYRVAWAILGNNADVADALQETALRAWQHRARLRYPQYFGTWATRICINVCRNMLRKRRPVVSLEDAPEPVCAPPDVTLSLALRALPEKLRLPLMLQYAEGMTYLEIARVLGITEPAVRGRIARAKHQLRKELDDSPVHESDCLQSPNVACRAGERRGGPRKELDECPVHESDCLQSPNVAYRAVERRGGPRKELEA